MITTVGVRNEKIEEAVLKLNGLEEKLEEINVTKGKEEGGAGTTYEKMEKIEKKVSSSKDSMKKLIEATVTFLEGTKETVQNADKKAGNRLERIV